MESVNKIECPVFRYCHETGRLIWNSYEFEISGKFVKVPRTIGIVVKREIGANGIGKEYVDIFLPPDCVYDPDCCVSFDPYDSNLYVPIAKFKKYKEETLKKYVECRTKEGVGNE